MIQDLSDTATVADALRRVFGAEHVTVVDGSVVCQAGTTRFMVTNDGRIETGMPLHELEAAVVDGLRVDPEAGSIMVVLPDAEYVFRCP